MELGPGAALFSHWRALRQFETPGYKALYYGLIFVPLGFFLALMAKIFVPSVGNGEWLRPADSQCDPRTDSRGSLPPPLLSRQYPFGHRAGECQLLLS